MSKCLDKVDEVVDEMEAIALRGMIRKLVREEMAAMRVVKCYCWKHALGANLRRPHMPCANCAGSGYVIEERRA